MKKPTNAYLRDVIFTPPPGGWQLSYRRTPKGLPTVPEMLTPGDEIELYSDGSVDMTLIVTSILGLYTYPDPGPDHPWFCIVVKHSDGKAGYINECVAVDGVVRGLFEANDMEIRLKRRESESAPPKREQLSLF